MTAPFAAVPKTTIYKNCEAFFFEINVGFTRDVRGLEFESGAGVADKGHLETAFRALVVLPANGRHNTGPFRRKICKTAIGQRIFEESFHFFQTDIKTGDIGTEMTNPEGDRTHRKFISFFSGAQGFDLGLERAGLECIAINDADPIVCETARLNHRGLAVYEGDIRGLTEQNLRADLKIEAGELFAIAGGPPCQAFSTAGRRLGLNDDRGNVFLHFIQLIKDLQPKYAIFENVRGLLSAPLTHRPHLERGSDFPALTEDELPGKALLHILELLEQAGYRTTFTLYNTANYGVPQIRERLIFFASRDGHDVPWMPPTHDENRLNGLKPWKTLRDAIQHLQGTEHHFVQFPKDRLKYYALLREGQNWRDLPFELQEAAMGDSWRSGGGRTGFFRRLAWDRPSPTLVTRPTMKATDLCHPEVLRPLSVEEYKAIQTFPDKHQFAGKIDDVYRQIGNAVPCLFGEIVGNHIIAFDEGRLATGQTNAKTSRYENTDHHSWRSSISIREDQLTLL
jgi:DNA (cytosine-5)-methyltransferase 1